MNAENILKQCQKEVAEKHGLGSSLVTGHKASYFTEASLLAMSKIAEQSWEACDAWDSGIKNLVPKRPDKSTYLNNLFDKEDHEQAGFQEPTINNEVI
jgi:hypothetical protein